MQPPHDLDLAPRAGVSRKKKLGLAAAALFLALATGELVLASRAENRVYRVWPPGLVNVFRPRSDLLPGITGESLFRVDSLGFRSDGPAATEPLSILALGGSTTECLYLDQSEAWPALLQERLTAALGRPVWVANAGKSGRTSRDHALQVRLLDQETRFDLVLLLAGVNDLGLWLGSDAAPALPSESERLRRAFDVLPLAREPGPFWRRLGTTRLIARSLAPWTGPPRVQDDAGAVYATWRGNRRAARAWRDELPDLRAGLAEFAANLGAIADACASRSVPLVLLTQPALWRAGLAPDAEALLWLGGVGAFQEAPGAEYYSTAALARGLTAYNRSLASLADERGLACIDLALLLEGASGIFYDDVHFNEEGARRAAELIAAELLTLDLLR